jgi:histidinol phosphatase-like enzyme
VLDNTYGSRAARNAVIETAWRHGVPVRCLWLKTSLEQAQVNAVGRMVARYGRLLDPEEVRSASAEDPGTFAPGVQFRHVRELEPPRLDEGFSRIEEVEFEPSGEPPGTNRAVLLWYDGVLRTSLSGNRTPGAPDDVGLLPGRREAIRRWSEEGWLLLGLSWHPEIASGSATREDVDACFERTHALLGRRIDVAYCPHADGPPTCWCRVPLPGLGVVAVQRYRLDPSRCLYVGQGASGPAFARRLGFGYREAAEFFET